MRGALIILLAVFAAGLAHAGEPPVEAKKYQRELTRVARSELGMDAPIAVLAAQIHQESRWNPKARSKFADGLAQFTPATAEWISGLYSKELGAADPFNPAWAIRAMIRYDKHIFDDMPAQHLCDQWAFTLAAYNGGPGWIGRDRALTRLRGRDPYLWFGNVERYSSRAAWAFKENRDYPRRILFTHQPLYAAWGGIVDCSHVQN